MPMVRLLSQAVLFGLRISIASLEKNSSKTKCEGPCLFGLILVCKIIGYEYFGGEWKEHK